MTIVPEDRHVFTLSIRVTAADIDNLNHVNNVVYLKWVQEVSQAHWMTAPSQMISECKWVVLKHEINYHSPALPNDEVEATTWIDPPEGPRQRRNVSIRRPADNKVLATAVTTWCLLDPVSGRPKRVSAEISKALGLKY